MHFSFMLSHTEWGVCLIRTSFSSLTVTRVACAQRGSGIRCVARTGSPMCHRAGPDAPRVQDLAGIRSDTDTGYNDFNGVE